MERPSPGSWAVGLVGFQRERVCLNEQMCTVSSGGAQMLWTVRVGDRDSVSR